MTATSTARLRERARIHRDLPEPPERRRLRETVGLTKTELAEAIGVSRQAIALWEAGKRTPRGDCLERYVIALRTLRKEAA